MNKMMNKMTLDSATKYHIRGATEAVNALTDGDNFGDGMDWTYKMVKMHDPKRNRALCYVVQVFDENGFLLGYL